VTAGAQGDHPDWIGHFHPVMNDQLLPVMTHPALVTVALEDFLSVPAEMPVVVPLVGITAGTPPGLDDR
jgi:hypothetical protein